MDEVLEVITLGKQGPPGPPSTVPGNTGPAGVGNTTLADDLVMPAVGTTVVAHVTTSAAMVPGQVVVVDQLGSLQVINAPDGTHVTLKNLGYTGNSAAGGTSPAGSLVAPGGLQGPEGPQGVQGNTGPQGPPGTGGGGGAVVNAIATGNVTLSPFASQLQVVDTTAGALTVTASSSAVANQVVNVVWGKGGGTPSFADGAGRPVRNPDTGAFGASYDFGPLERQVQWTLIDFGTPDGLRWEVTG